MRPGGSMAMTAAPNLPGWARRDLRGPVSVDPTDLAALLDAACHASATAVGLALSTMTDAHLPAAAFALLTMDRACLHGTLASVPATLDASPGAVGLRAVALALDGDLAGAGRLAEDAGGGPGALSLVRSLRAALVGDHHHAATLAEPWIAAVGPDLAAPAAAAALALVVSGAGDHAGVAYWADALAACWPACPTVQGLQSEASAALAGERDDRDALRRALELRRATLDFRPGHVAIQKRWVELVEQVGWRQVGHKDRALARYFSGQGSAPRGTFWADPLDCWCDQVGELSGALAERALGSHLLLLGGAGLLAFATCTTTGASWVVLPRGLLGAGSPVRALRMPGVSFTSASATSVPVRAADQLR